MMIDIRKNMKTMILNKADVSSFYISFRVTTVKSDQKSNINKYYILFCAISVLFTTIKYMVVVYQFLDQKPILKQIHGFLLIFT